ncbi:MAG TPA: methionine--tRNA ligase subunit beta [Phycisphaerae bacterium]|nr:methionine--tRNA ligase subunit beta [Phycisphaerae bacterium]
MDDARPIPTQKPLVKFDDFARLDLRVAKILECREHPNADKLLILKVELAAGETRQICAPLKNHYAPADLVGKLVVIIANLEPRSMRGELSQGMLLSASEGPMKQRIVILSPESPLTPGSPVS